MGRLSVSGQLVFMTAGDRETDEPKGKTKGKRDYENKNEKEDQSTTGNEIKRQRATAVVIRVVCKITRTSRMMIGVERNRPWEREGAEKGWDGILTTKTKARFLSFLAFPFSSRSLSSSN